MKKRIIGLALMLALCLGLTAPAFAADALGTYGASKSVQVFQKAFSEGSEEANLIESIVVHNTAGQEGSYTVGSAFVIYNLDESASSYMIPVFNDQKCVGMIHMSQDLDVGMTFTSDTVLYDKVFDLPRGEYILYVTGGMLYAESSDRIVLLQDMGISQTSNDERLTIPYEEKLEALLSQVGEICTLLDINVIQDETICVDTESKYHSTMVQPYMEDPLYEIKSCNITKFVTQENKPLCWAACVATIVNFKKGFNLTAIDVANEIDANYESPNYRGESLETTAETLNRYGVRYMPYNSKLRWSTVKTNIGNNNPFIIGAQSVVGKHMVTAYGYSFNSRDDLNMTDERYVTAWNPGSEMKFSFQYNSSTFSYAGYTWTWITTIAN